MTTDTLDLGSGGNHGYFPTKFSGLGIPSPHGDEDAGWARRPGQLNGTVAGSTRFVHDPKTASMISNSRSGRH